MLPTLGLQVIENRIPACGQRFYVVYLEDIQYMLAEIEADDIAERLNMGKRRAIEKGQRWVGIFKPPYGYDKVGHSHNARMEINEEQAKVIRQVFEWYVHGDEDGKPLRVPTIVKN